MLDKSNSIQPTVRLSLCQTLFTGPFRAIPIETTIRLLELSLSRTIFFFGPNNPLVIES